MEMIPWPGLYGDDLLLVMAPTIYYPRWSSDSYVPINYEQRNRFEEKQNEKSLFMFPHSNWHYKLIYAMHLYTHRCTRIHSHTLTYLNNASFVSSPPHA